MILKSGNGDPDRTVWMHGCAGLSGHSLPAQGPFSCVEHHITRHNVRKRTFMFHQRILKSVGAFAQSDQNLRCSLKKRHLLISIKRPVNAQADLNLCWAFSDVATPTFILGKSVTVFRTCTGNYFIVYNIVNPRFNDNICFQRCCHLNEFAVVKTH